ncbi:MAG: Hsp70 family protein [Chloroflexi bacterium]|nr:Hsp70 family protein [Chloroflexota bacterium]
MASSPIIGIDLGTTFSAVGHVQNGLPVILPNGSERIVPSVVGFTPEGALVVGTPARNQYALYPERTMRSIKRRMGTDVTVILNGRAYTPAEISAIILREMKRIAEANIGEAVTRAVITVPAFFSDAARQATKEAGEVAGFTVERILNEPTAAALAYGLDRGDDKQLVAVYDLGGGTFDVSIIELNQGVIEVRASHGDTHLGGDDFDERLVDLLAERFEAEHGLDPRGERRALARLTRAAEQAKITLSSQPFARVREEYLLEKDRRPLHLDAEIARSEFEDLIRDLLEGTLNAFDQALADAGLKAGDLDKVLFVGGSTRIPAVWEMIAQHIGLEPMVEVNPDEAVALGAGVQAALIAGEPLDTVLVDVTPHSLGIEVAEWLFGQLTPDHYSIILRRNTTLPTTRAQVFSAITPDQTAIEVKVYQGESPIASRNTLLGEFLFEDLKPEIPGQPPHITVEFDLDVNGILRISAADRGSGQVKQTTLRAAHTRLSPSDKEASARYIADLWEREVSASDMEEADDPLLSRARSLLVNRVEEMRPLADLVARLEAARREGRETEAAELGEQLLDLLYELEDRETEG